MSSKSKKQKRKPQRGHGKPSGEPAAAPERHGLEIPDEILHAPKETSKLRLALMIGLVIVLLVIFIVPSALFNIADGGGAADQVELSWMRPGQGLQEVTGSQYIQEKRAFEAALTVDPLLGYQFGLPQGTIEREQVARLIVLDQLALDAGIRVNQTDLAEHLRLLLSFPPYNRSADVYKQVALQYGGGSIEYVEANIKRCLRGQRYLTLAGFVGGVADPAAIEEAWNNDHLEVSFDVIELPVADLADAARAELPDEEALQAWFDEQPGDVQGELKLPERRAVQFVRFVGPATTPAAELLASFPEPEDADPEDRANEYYNRVFHLRFVKPPADEDAGEEDPGAEEDGDEAAAAQAELQEFMPFEEVREQCLTEAPVYYAMTEWLTDLTTRQNAGEEIDVAAEAARYGLQFSELAEPLTREELEADAEFGDDRLVNEAFFTPPEAFGYSVLTTDSGLSILRVTERVEPTLPAFAEIRDAVADLWVEPRRAELATERLQAIWESFEEYEPEEDEEEDLFRPPDNRTHRRATAEAFRAAAEEAGLTVTTRDFKDKADASFGDDDYLYFDYDVDEVGEPTTIAEGESVALMRVSGNREVPIERMSPRDYERYKSRARSEVASSVATGFDLAYLEQAYDLWLRPIEKPEDEAAEEEPAE